jgi:hypothetical protein
MHVSLLKDVFSVRNMIKLCGVCSVYVPREVTVTWIKTTLLKVLCGKVHCHNVKFTYLAKGSVF